jgi:hypothetical protein
MGCNGRSGPAEDKDGQLRVESAANGLESEATAFSTPSPSATALPPTDTAAPTETPSPAATSSLTPEPETDTPSPNPTETHTPTPPITPTPAVLNGLPMDEVIVMSDEVQENVLAIYERGLELGRDPNAFSKIGDSTIEPLNFFARFDEGAEAYNLGEFAYLQRAIDYYSGSFARQGFALIRGLHSWSVFDPFWADEENCLADETVIDCEFRQHNPSVVLIRLGSNDRAPSLFEENLRLIVSYSIEQGVIPVLATKPDRVEGEGNRINLAIRRVAEEYAVPLWDFDLVSSTLPDNGLSEDGIHMTTFYSYDYTEEQAFERGHGLQNLTGLIALDAVSQWILQQMQQ